MEQTAVQGASHLLNYGVLGIFALIMLVVIWQLWKHLKAREAHHEAKYQTKEEESTKLTMEFTRMVAEFKNESIANREAMKHESIANRDVLRDLKNVIHSKI